MADIAELTKQIATLAASPPANLTEEGRYGLYTAIVYETVAVRLGIDLKLFDIAVPAGRPLTVTELSEKADPHAQLVGAKNADGYESLHQGRSDAYAAKPLAGIYCADPPLREAVIHLSRAHFNTVTGISRTGQVDWFDFYPVEEKLKVASPSDILLVDVGGGVGHDVVAFQRKFPYLQGKLVFQDLPIVVEAAKDVPAGIESIGHEFFQQPVSVKRAKIYCMRTVLHDWPDKQARTIIKNTKDVMSEDSILFINENILLAQGISLYQAKLDIAMMACFSSLDRTEKQFKELLESEGFKSVGTHKPQVQIPRAGALLEFCLAE
ncbi:S-adenosyl-L-methionine-dependent methyltransferase [Lentithecium fluviatile CBS 122367]|uniref:S-adenosyl-L-methionine-dependent methyltransferase n=1 Tax=Lentithecium fluviatile CBS 122367 TaxID=1168545 RepID=A0A6G1IMQ1_9PLEO|nr:S-adenosyl-L-methionine-dependent methyltransferase [Lentithecium fluviatile CBS 122367]